VRRVIRARIGYFAGVLLVAAGFYLAIGLGWGLVALGLMTAAAFVWLYDVSDPADAVVTRQDDGSWT
jgi:hypothetical protein